MAGGAGIRLWPASTSSRPKQFLSIPPESIPPEAGKRRYGGRNRSFLSAAIERALAVTSDSDNGRVIIVAGKKHIGLIVDECAKINTRERERLVLIPEPLAKNTAPAIACALLYIDRVSAGKEQNVLVLTSDHIIQPLNLFKTDAYAAARMAGTDNLVVFGIPPVKPETGYGYIEAAEAITIPPDKKNRSRRYKPEAFSVASFREKPDIKKAKKFIASRKFYWNSGMFAFSSKFLLAEFSRCSPEVIAPFNKLGCPAKHSYLKRRGLKILDGWDNLETAYSKSRSISFDYAVAEKCRAIVMIKAGFSWIDVGSWDEYVRLAGNTQTDVYGTKEAIGTCFVDSDIPVALCGVEDLIVVLRSGKDGRSPALLISKKGETQRIKEIAEEIKASGRTDLL